MNLLIHDLDKEEWAKIADQYAGWDVVSDNGGIKPCAGCFGCWIKNPGQCIIKDGYEDMGERIHRADEVVVMSRYTYGGFSSFVKNVIDRSISYMLPFFEMYRSEMHHMPRYVGMKNFTFIFRGYDLTEDDKTRARSYVEAVCRNLQSACKDVIFEEDKRDPDVRLGLASKEETNAEGSSNGAGISDLSGKTVFLNCSPRGKESNSYRFLNQLETRLDGDVERLDLVSLNGRYAELAEALDAADRLVLGMPLYVDGVHAAPLRLMEMMEYMKRKAMASEEDSADFSDKKVYVVVNMGFYESHQLVNLLGMVKVWCEKCGYTYGGALAIGAGEMLGMMMRMPDISKGPTKNVATGMDKLSEAINTSGTTEDIYVGPNRFPRYLYLKAGNSSWHSKAKANGLKQIDIYRKY